MPVRVPPGRSRPGFTLIELLVVIAIIAVLIGLLLPAVQKVREAANNAKCQNNLKQCALASHTFESTYKYMPPALTDDRSAFPNRRTANAWFHLLPFVEQQAVYTQGTKTNPLVNADGYNSKMSVAELAPVPVKPFLCPSDGTHPAHVTGPFDFAVHGQNPVMTPQGVALQYSTMAYVANVMVFDAANYKTITAAMPDGTSNVPVIGHRLERCSSSGIGFATFDVFNYTFADQRNITPYRSFPFTGFGTYWRRNGGTGTPSQSNGVFIQTDKNFRGIWGINQDFLLNNAVPFLLQPGEGMCHPFAMVTPHPVMVIALGDGSVRTISASVSAQTWLSAWIPDDGTVQGSDW